VRVDESILTGESVAVDKGEGDRLYSGTFIVEGEGLAVVEATAGATRLASLAALTTRVRRHVTPLAREIRRLVRTTTFIAVGVGLVFVIASTALGFDIESGLVFGIGVIVALVPEALLPTVTLSLAIGAQRMATHHALIRRLEAVETLGSTTFLCTDKTGTLTQNRMAVVEVWTPRGSATVSGIGYEPEGEVSVPSDEVEALVTDVAIAARRCSTGRAVLEGSAWTAVGDPMEAALDVLARRVGVAIDDVVAADPELARFPFDARRRRMSVVTKDGVFVKGAPDAVFPVCVNATQDAFRAVEALSTRGLRVLAVAVRHVRPGDVSEAISVERDLELAGLIGLEDPRDHPPPALSRRAARPG
jgi:magnesium-transporting ATPase (P-type)